MSDDAARVVLLLEPPVGSSANGACRDLLADDDDPTSVLSVLYGESVEERARRLRSRTDGVASAAFVAVNPTTAPTDVGAVRTVPNPGDLTTVGVAVTE